MPGNFRHRLVLKVIGEKPSGMGWIVHLHGANSVVILCF
jgi:hypothetical protein